MPTPRYVEFAFNPNYFQYFLSGLPYDQSLLDKVQVDLEQMKKINFLYANSKLNIPKDKVNSIKELYAAVSKYLTEHHHAVTEDALVSMYAVAVSRYYFYQKFFGMLKFPIVPEKASELTIDFNANQNIFEINLTQKESKLGDFTEWHLKSNTVFKARQKINLDITTKKITSAENIVFNVSSPLWNSKLQSAANEYLNNKRDEAFSQDDILVLTPFLMNQDFLNAYAKKYVNQTYPIQELAKQVISECFNADANKHIMVTLTPISRQPPVPSAVPSVRPRNASSTSSIIISDEKAAPPAIPVPLPATPEEDFNQSLADLMKYVVFESYEDSQLPYLKNLANSITSLSQKERKQHYALLADVMRRAEVAMKTPSDSDNLNASLMLIEPLKKNNMHKVALAFTAIIVGAIIVTASLAVTLASFGVTSGPAVFGISVGTGLLTKGLAILVGVVGLGIAAVGFRLFSHRPYKPVIDNVESMNLNAHNYNIRHAHVSP